MNEKLKAFNINIDDIETSFDYMSDIRKAIAKMHNEYDIKNLEIVLNKNIISVFDKVKNCRALLGCRVSFDNLEKDISFIVREDTKPSYENLEQQLQSYKDKEDKIKEYCKTIQEKYKFFDKSNTTDASAILEIIGGSDDK